MTDYYLFYISDDKYDNVLKFIGHYKKLETIYKNIDSIRSIVCPESDNKKIKDLIYDVNYIHNMATRSSYTDDEINDIFDKGLNGEAWTSHYRIFDNNFKLLIKRPDLEINFDIIHLGDYSDNKNVIFIGDFCELYKYLYYQIIIKITKTFKLPPEIKEIISNYIN